MGSEGEDINNSGHVLALFSVDNNMIESDGASQVAILNEEQIKELETLYWQMNYIETEIIEIPWDDEDYPQPIPSATPEITPYRKDDDTTPTATPTPEPYKIKNINVTCLSYQDMLDEFDFTDNQLMVLEDMMSGEYAALFSSLGGNTTSLSDEQITEILSKLPADIYYKAANIPTAAKSLIGKVNYFWGGKYNEPGMCPEWGTMKTVTSPGSTTTGTKRPYGLDCSGYVAWVFINSGISKDIVSGYFGSGSNKQWEYSIPVTVYTVQIGDLAFKSVPGTGVNHVGVVVGFDSDGKSLVAHCSSGNNGVAVTSLSSTFKYLRRPVILLNGEGG
jgi:cell wall-associated NlpC family hydrolase